MKYTTRFRAVHRLQIKFVKARFSYISQGAKLLCFLIIFAEIVFIANPVAASPSWIDLLGQLKGQSKLQQSVNLHHLIEREASKYKLPSSFIASIIQIESNFNSCAVSHKQAQGIMQLITKTATSVGVNDPFDPVQGVQGGSFYLAQAYQSTRNLYMSAAYYNAGPKVLKLHRDQWPAETQNYVVKLAKVWKQYQGNRWKKYVPKQVERTSRTVCRSRFAYQGRFH